MGVGIGPKDPMNLPDKPVKKTPKKQLPVGAQKNGALKVLDGDTGRVKWRRGSRGFLRDYDGDPISVNYTAKYLKKRPKHSPRMGRRPMHKPHMGDREGAYS